MSVEQEGDGQQGWQGVEGDREREGRERGERQYMSGCE